MQLTDVTGLAGLWLAWVCLPVMLVARVLPDHRQWPARPAALAVLAVAVAVLAWWPVRGVPLLEYVRGALGDLSISSVCLLTYALWGRLWPAAARTGARQWQLVRWLIVAGALILYPASLDTGGWAPYQWGYGNPWLQVALLAITLVAWRCGCLRLVIAITLALLAWTLGLLESRNLWDYLIDPMLSLWAFGSLGLWLARRVSASLWRRLRRPPVPSGDH